MGSDIEYIIFNPSHAQNDIFITSYIPAYRNNTISQYTLYK